MQSPKSSEQSAHSETAATLIGRLYPPLQRYWPRLPTVSAPQAAFLVLDHREAFYGGAAGGGKSDALLAAALQYVDKPGYSALLLRRTYPELEGSDGLIAKAHEWLGPHRQSGEVSWNEQKHRWTFNATGAVIQFGHVKNEADMTRYQGQAYQLVAFDELTHFTERIYDYIAFTRARRNKDMEAAGIPIRARSASNPGGVGHGWVKKRFVDQASRKPNVVFVPAKLADNPGLDTADYAASLADIPEELRKQLLDGNWNAFENQAFPKFGAPHIVQSFPLGDAHSRLEACDYGLNGTAWYLIPTDYEGNVVFYDSITEADLLPDEVCELVLAKRADEWGHSNTVRADPAIWHRTSTRNKWGAPAVLADEFADNGVHLTQANNDPRAGLIRLRALMEPDPERRFPAWHPLAGDYGSPRLFVVAPNCPELVEQFSAAPLQPIDKPDGGEKIDPVWESRYGHSTAAARYGAMAKPGPSEEPPAEGDMAREEMQQELLRRHAERVADTDRTSMLQFR